MRIADAIARRYSTDPWTVLQWGAERMAAAAAGYAAGEEARADRLAGLQSSETMMFPVLDVLAGV